MKTSDLTIGLPFGDLDIRIAFLSEWCSFPGPERSSSYAWENSDDELLANRNDYDILSEEDLWDNEEPEDLPYGAQIAKFH